jgi:hypothetical protein
MKRGAFMEDAGLREARATPAEDPLDSYRRYVERYLGHKLVLLEEESFERFFDHVIASFNRGVLPDECARTWLHPRRDDGEFHVTRS